MHEQLEARCMLSVSPAGFDVAPVDPSLADSIEPVIQHLASSPDSAFLFEGNSDLRFLEVASDAGDTLTRFQQTIDGIPVYNAFVTVVQNDDTSVEDVFNHGRQFATTLPTTGNGLTSSAAETIANTSESDIAFTHSSLVWFPTGNTLTQAWQVNGASYPLAPYSFGDTLTIVGLDAGEILTHEKLDSDYLGQFESHTGIFPRIVINNTVGAAGSRAYAEPFEAVVSLPQGCSGTLITPTLVISARHCGSTSSVRFGPNENAPILTSAVSATTFPDGNGSLLDGGDVSLLRLSQPVPASVATPMRLIEEGDRLEGQVAATIGYGFNGLGSNGHGFSSDGFRWGGENIIDVYGAPVDAGGSNIFSTDFDNASNAANTIPGSDATPLEFEATTAPGDSGGPLLVQTEEGEWVIAGVLSGGTTNDSTYGDISWWTGVAPFRDEIEAAGGEFVGGGLGSVSLNQGFYSDGDVAMITVFDSNAGATVEVELTTDSGDVETLTLSNTQGASYSGSVSISTDSVTAGDGTLQGSISDEIEITYIDVDDGIGVTGTRTATATIANFTEYASSDVPFDILDNQRIFSDIEITDSGTISDVNVQLDITHTFVGDLQIFLNGPDGSRITLVDQAGGGGSNFDNTLLDDEAPTSVQSGDAPFAGQFSPVGSLSTFDDMSVTGTWTLEIVDNAFLDQGSLEGWSLFVDLGHDAVSSDFNGDGFHDCNDIDSLTTVIAAGSNDLSFDVTGDGVVDSADLDAWLSDAANANGLPGPYLDGDFNLDGSVDGSDFNIWNENKFTASSAWCEGDSNADGAVDGSDFNIWNENKFTSSSRALPGSPTSLISTGKSHARSAPAAIETVALEEAPVVLVAANVEFQLPTLGEDRIRQRISPIDAVFADLAELGDELNSDGVPGRLSSQEV